MNARTARLAMPATFTPPPWLVATIAAALAVLLLSVFVDTVYENIRRGDALRQAQAQAQAVRGSAGDLVMAHSARVPRLR